MICSRLSRWRRAGVRMSILAIGLLAGCEGEEDVRVYTVSKDAATQPTMAGSPGTAPVASTNQPPAAAEARPVQMAWAVPRGWEEVTEPKPMRVATFRRPDVTTEEIVVSQFPGDVGGVLANVNRWRQQVGLGPITEAELATEVQPFDNGTLKGHTMRLRGERQHMLAAIISEPAAERTWFVKATTTPMAADTLEADLYAFARSFGAGQAPADGKTDSAATQPAK